MLQSLKSKLLFAGLLAALLLLQARLWFGPGGLQEVRDLREQVDIQRAQNQGLLERNRSLAAEVQDLKEGTAAIEERARTDLGMVGRSETFYQVVPPSISQPAPEPPR